LLAVTLRSDRVAGAEERSWSQGLGPIREPTGRFANGASVVRDLLQIGPHGAPEVGERDARPALEHGCTKLPFQGSNRVGEGGLRDAAAPRCPSEVQFIAQGQEISDLMHFHGSNPLF
jgi:hypothetical protein